MSMVKVTEAKNRYISDLKDRQEILKDLMADALKSDTIGKATDNVMAYSQAVSALFLIEEKLVQLTASGSNYCILYDDEELL